VAMVSFGRRLQVASDLHLESRRGECVSNLLRYNGATALLLAGDIGPIALVAKVFERWPVPVIYVLGNHEYAMSAKLQVAPPSGEKWLNRNVLLLENGVASDGNNRIVGCCLWTDFDLLGQQAHAMELAKGEMAGGARGRRTHTPAPETSLGWHLGSVNWLTEVLSTATTGHTVALSHHAPHRRSLVQYRYHSNFDAAFASDLTRLLRKTDIWIHGHLHHSLDYQVGRCRVLCNPLGSIGHPNGQFVQNLTVFLV
jgi:predicted phosphodiesterase